MPKEYFMEYVEEQYILDIVQALANENASIMVGAGFSKNAKYHGSKANKMSSWYELTDKFYNILYGEDEKNEKEYLNPISLAEEVEIMYGRKKLHDIIMESLPDMDHAPSKIHYQLLNLPWKDIFTTNYDTLLERASEDVVNRNYRIVNNKEDLICSAMSPRIIKLHGSFPSHTPFIITEEDYRLYPKDYAPFVNTVQQALLENLFCMIGFSGTDPNFLNWIGWLSDNYNNIVPQKIYMISVNGESEVQKEKLRTKNIIVIDLAQIWPNTDSAEERISRFLTYIEDKFKRKEEEKIKWISRKDIDELFSLDNKQNKSNEEKIRDYTKFIKLRIDSYPGWIALPERYKNLTGYILRYITEDLYNLKNIKISICEKINYIYEYVLFKDICDRPIFRKEVDIIKSILGELENGSEEQIYKINIIKVMLLRSYRELGLKEEFDLLIRYIDKERLDEYYINFLKYEECMMELHSLNIQSYEDKVLKWDVDIYNHYWMLRKLSLLVKFEDYVRCEEMAIDTLKNLRRIKYKKLDNELIRNQSIEDCLVKLTNHIKQAIKSLENDKEYEETKIKNKELTKNEFNWFEENKLYRKSFESKYIEKPRSKTLLSFDLGVKKIKESFKAENSEVIEAFDYLRFREVTGTPFVIGNLVDKKGINEVLTRIVDYNSSLAFITCLKANENKGIDCIYNRKFLSKITMKDADSECNKFINLINDYLLKEIDEKSWFIPKNIYDYCASLLPEIISRLITKCSLKVRDEVLETCLNIYCSNKVKSFKNMDKLIKRLLNSYTHIEIVNRLSIILDFPVIEEEREYLDPISFVIPKLNFKKQKLDEEEYNKIIEKLFFNEEISYQNKLRRMVLIYFLIEFNEIEKEKLEEYIWSGYDGEKLPEIHGFYQSILLDLPHSRYISKKELENKLKNKVLLELRGKSTVSENGVISLKTDPYKGLNIMNELISKKVLVTDEFEPVLDIILNISKKYINDLKSYDFFGQHHITINRIALCGVLISKFLLNYPEICLTVEVNSKMEEFFKKIEAEGIFLSSLKIIYNLYLGNEDGILDIVKEGTLYNRNNEFTDIISALNVLIDDEFVSISDDIKLKWLEILFNRLCISSFEDSYNAIFKLSDIIDKLSNEYIDKLSKYIIILLEKSLVYIDIGIYDNNEEVISKIIYKKAISELVNTLYNKDYEFDGKLKELILEWKSICEDENEFIEVRKPWLE